MSAKITGLDAFKRRLADGAAMRGLKNAADESSAALRAAAERRLAEVAPDEASKIAASMSVETAADGLRVRLRADGDRAAALEFGTLKRPAQPWLEPALTASRQAVVAAFARWFKMAIEGARP